METVTPTLAVITGMALRLVIPVAITGVAVYFLRRLDTRWVAEAEEQLQLPVVEKPKCWEILGCSGDNRATCQGYLSEQPCWQAFRKENGYLKENCLGCDVFRKAPIPAKL